MAFRPISVPSGDNWLDDQTVTLGLAETDFTYSEFLRTDHAHRFGNDISIEPKLEQERRGQHQRDRADPDKHFAREHLLEREVACRCVCFV